MTAGSLLGFELGVTYKGESDARRSFYSPDTGEHPHAFRAHFETVLGWHPEHEPKRG
jgi:hypothetical protein